MSEPASETQSSEELDLEQVVASISGSAKQASLPSPGDGPSVYDFSHPDLLSRDQARALRTLHEGYAQVLAKRLSTELLANVSAHVTGVDHLTFGEFLLLLPTPTALAVVDVPELEGKVALDLSPSLAFAFVDRLLGGKGATLETTRALTAIEMGLMDRILRKACHELDGMWSPILELHFRTSSIESNPELARIVNPEEMVVLISFDLAINDVKGAMNLCLPYVVVEPAIHRLGQGTSYTRVSGEDAEAIRGALGQTLGTAPLLLEADLGEVAVTLGELLQLGVGDVLRITPSSRSGAGAFLQGARRMNGEPGRHKSHRAFRVTEVLSVPGQKGE